ncbi:MAG: methyltransferase domain-containing protein [Cyanobacteria bacterium J06635_15]
MTSTANLYQQIQQFYDATSGLWEQVWGEHMHHGYYGSTGTHQKNRRQAQIDLNEEVLAWGKVTQANSILDVGCGIGGSTLYLAEKYNARAIGITLSPVQAERAKARSQAAGLDPDPNHPDKIPLATFQIANALEMPFEDNQFDLIWSMESGEHMPDKQKFLQECYQLLKPGGTFLMATWCHRPTNTLAGVLTPDEQNHLQQIYDIYCLPYVISLLDYDAIARQVGFQSIRTADWSTAVAPFWNLVIDSAINLDAIAGIVKVGWPAIQGTFALQLMGQGFNRGLIRYGLLCGTK